MRKHHVAAVRLAAILVLATQGEAMAQQPADIPDAQAVIRRVLQRNPSLETFQSRMHVRVHMLNFPWISLHLEGTSYFKRPNAYEVVFDRVPGYASSLKHVFADIADPVEWQRDWKITCLGLRTVDGAPLLLLQMTKPDSGARVREQDAFIDPASFAVARMEWHYTDGGSITMTQTYKTEGSYVLISSQHADIQIPHVRAVADASYDTYQTNVAVSDSVFQSH